MTTWKSAERNVAKLLGGERVPITGRARGSAPDVQHPLFSIEVKHRQSLPSWILEAMEQADASNPGDKKSIVILHQKGKNYLESLTMMKLSDIIALQKQIEDMEVQIEDLKEDLRHEGIWIT